MRSGFFQALLTLSVATSGIKAWTNHYLLNQAALAALPEISRAPQVKVEALEEFLLKEQTGLTLLMAQSEAEARIAEAKPAPQPEALAFKGGDARSIRRNFLRALRLNPEIPLGYYLQQLPGKPLRGKKAAPAAVSIFAEKDLNDIYRFYEMRPGETASALDILATASDEPDFGHDIFLFADNGSNFGREYGFGEQSFGDPKKYFSSQAPFHMGFYHESGIIFLAGPFLKRTYPPYRVRQFTSLARFAFKTGHPYWGYRFLGWGLHYVGDLSQPYHTRVLPNYGTLGMLWIYIKDVFGFSSDKNDAIERVSSRHSAIEDYHFYTFARAYAEGNGRHPFVVSLAMVDADKRYGEYNDAYIVDAVARESYDLSDQLDNQIEKSNLIHGFAMGKLKPEINAAALAELDTVLARLMQGAGAHARNYVRVGLR